MQQCNGHVKLQFPNEHSRVGYLLETIKTTGPLLQSSIALIRNDDDPATWKQSSFEATDTFLLPNDYVAKKHNNNPSRHRRAEISSMDTSNIKSGVVTTGVSFC